MTGPRRWRLVRAPTAAIPASVRRFNQRVRRRRLRAVAPWLAGLLALAVVALVALVLTGTSLFGVRHLVVRGNTLVSVDQVRAAAAVPGGAPLATLDTAGIARRVVAGLPPVRQARVTRDWPTTVVITITERTATAALARPDQRFDLIDATGVVFQTVPMRPAGLVLLTLSVPGPDDPSTRAALSVLDALPTELRALVVTLVAPAPTRVRLELTGHRTIIWGDATHGTQKARVALALLAQSGSVIDVSSPSLATVN